ncbi:MAG: Osmosensitive channel histidine kinase KdpD [Actinomycetia bacterium]|nr:Osmosensitive channel histidine kinase KdpD [Actinomycetes bacterium]
MAPAPELRTTRLLVIDDEARFGRALALGLRPHGYEVEVVTSGEEGLARAASSHPDLILLDLGLPGLDGLQVLGGLRGWTEVPVVVLSARHHEPSKVAALDAGADDYVTKPFGMEELLARLRAARRRASVTDVASVVCTEHFRLDLAARQAWVGDEVRHLTPKEWQLVDVLVRNPGRLVTHRQLLQEVWGPQYGTETDYLRAFLATIRRKLEPVAGRPRYFRTEPGMGYRFEP